VKDGKRRLVEDDQQPPSFVELLGDLLRIDGGGGDGAELALGRYGEGVPGHGAARRGGAGEVGEGCEREGVGRRRRLRKRSQERSREIQKRRSMR
jgi:hypothetical protein